jgi:hypothetical protein
MVPLLGLDQHLENHIPAAQYQKSANTDSKYKSFRPGGGVFF